MNVKSLELWEKYGEYLLMAFPTVDNVIDHGEGCFMVDVDGNRILDLASGQLCSTVGMRHPKLSGKVIEQAGKIFHTGTQFMTQPVFEASQKFAEVAPKPLKRSIFLSTGAEANESAIRMAKTITGRTGMIGFSRGYHGMTLATRSITSIFAASGKVDAQPVVPETGVLLTPHCLRCPVYSRFPECDFACLKTSLELMGNRIDNVAAFVVEPVLSPGGVIVPPKGYLARLKDIAHEHGALLIADEAQTAFGRTGKWFGIEHHGVVPDIMVVSKSAGGGFPASGVIVDEQMADILERKSFTHLSSHQWDPLAAASVCAVIDIIREERLVEKAGERGEYFMDRLMELQKKWPVIVDVRGQGLIIGVELGSSTDVKLPALASLIMIYLCRKRGVHLTTTYFEPTLRIMPPLTISMDEIDLAISVLDAAFKDMMGNVYSIDDIMPQNHHSRRFMKRMAGKKDLEDYCNKVLNTRPTDWLKKLKDVGKKSK